MRKIFLKTLYYGAIWGILEATLGYVLHLISFYTGARSFSGLIMYPIGLFFMYKAFVDTRNYYSIFLISFICASIKLFNLFLPFVPYYHTINPAIAILLEGLSSYIFIRYFDVKGILKNILRFTASSMIWRVLFIIVLSLIDENRIKNYLNFILVESIINGLIIGLFVDRIKVSYSQRFRLNPFLLYPIGVLTQIFISFITWKF